MKAFRVSLVCVVVLAALFVSVGPASAGNNNTGCGAGFQKISNADLSTFMSTTYDRPPGAFDDFIQSVDKNGDLYVCWKWTGKTCPCGAEGINVVDDKSNATQT